MGTNGQSEKSLQKVQYARFWRWKKREGAIHQPTHPDTYKQPEQVRRVNWIVERCKQTSESADGLRDILEIGCSGGYIVEKAHGRCGLDINPKTIVENCVRNSRVRWVYHDATKRLPFPDGEFEVALLPDILEHNSWRHVGKIIGEALRVSRGRVLITIPKSTDLHRSRCFKHKWVCTPQRLRSLTGRLSPSVKIRIHPDPNFILMEVTKHGS